MLTRDPKDSTLDFTHLLPPGHRWTRIALVASGAPNEAALSAACAIARRDGGNILVYDVTAASGLTSPYPPGDGGWLPALFDEAGMRRVGRDDLVTVAENLADNNLLAGIYLAPKSDAADLASLVDREGVDLVISLLPSGDRRLTNVHDARRHAHLLLASPGAAPVLRAPFRPGEAPQRAQGIGWPYLLVVVVTFFLARGRNLAR